MNTVAVIQPYFVPYAGYFRAFAHADHVVMLDCDAFAPGGWVHRNRLPDAQGALSWLTLPVEESPDHPRIDQLRWARDAHRTIADRTSRFPALTEAPSRTSALSDRVLDLAGRPVDYLIRLLRDCCAVLELPCSISRASELDGLDGLHGQELILEIVSRMHATTYLDLPIGRDPYDAAAFAERGIELRVLGDYEGSSESILSRLLTEDPDGVRQEIMARAS